MYSYNYIKCKSNFRTVINATLEFITIMNLTTKYSVAKSKQVQLSLLLIRIILKRSAVVFIIIFIPTFALNVEEGYCCGNIVERKDPNLSLTLTFFIIAYLLCEFIIILHSIVYTTHICPSTI